MKITENNKGTIHVQLEVNDDPLVIIAEALVKITFQLERMNNISLDEIASILGTIEERQTEIESRLSAIRDYMI